MQVAIRFISSSHKTELKAFPQTNRIYLGLRLTEYAQLDTSDDTYTLITSGDNQPGSHNLTGGHIDALYTMPTVGTIEVQVYPNFAFDTASIHPIFAWYIGATEFLQLRYAPGNDRFYFEFRDGVAAKYMVSQQFDDGSSHTNINQWLTFTITWDLGNETGEFWVNRVSQDDSWSGALDAEFTVQNILRIREGVSGTGDYKINYLRLFDSVTATDADVQNAFEDIKTEEIFWCLNGHGNGRDRVNITGFVDSWNLDQMLTEPLTGSEKANTFNATLRSKVGEFADDQYAAWDPDNAVYNGTSSQKYLKQRSRVYIENWYGTVYDYLFSGRLERGLYSRRSGFGVLSKVRIEAKDAVAEMAGRKKRNPEYWEDKKLSDATPANSLVHLFVKEAMNKTVYNFLGNSSFENATITNSWTAAGSVALSKDAVEYFHGAASGQLDFTGAGTLTQIVTFDGAKKLNKGETWNFSLFAKSASACTFSITLYEYDSVGTNDNTATNCTLAGGEGWKRFNISHAITDGDSDEIRVILADTGTLTIFLDAAALVQSSIAPLFLVENTNDGTAGTIDADDEGSAEYERIGIDSEAVNITHPWARMEEGETPWSHLKDISNATAAYKFGVDSSGTFTFRSLFGAGYPPSSLETITSVSAVSASAAASAINKIVVHGAKIIKNDRITYLWIAPYTHELFDIDSAGNIREEILNGASWPNTTTYPQFWARYGDIG